MQPGPRHVAAARALAAGDPLAALNAVAGDTSGHGRALRGIALAQLDELDEAQRELRAAALALRGAPLFRARALAALAEVAAARRELGSALEELQDAADALEVAGDARNASWARLVRARVLLLVGDVDEAWAELERSAGNTAADPVIEATRSLARAALAAQSLSGDAALAALDGALAQCVHGPHPLLAGELAAHRDALAQPLARLTVGGRTATLALPALARVFRGGGSLPLDGVDDAPHEDRKHEQARSVRRWFVVDAIARRVCFCGERAVDLGSRDVLFALVSELARAWPDAAHSDTLISSVFAGPPGEASHLDRLRVELGRLRRLLPCGATIRALGGSWCLALSAGEVVARLELLAEASTLSALLADGKAWAARDLALALGASPRTVQRALAELAAAGGAHAVGRARSQRWLARGARVGIATQMFLVGLLRPVEPLSTPRDSAPSKGEGGTNTTAPPP